MPPVESESILPASAKAIFAILFGAALTIGGCVALYSNKWPLYLPIQFDAVEAFFSIFGDKTGIYVGSAAVLLIGLIVLISGIIALIKRKGF